MEITAAVTESKGAPFALQELELARERGAVEAIRAITVSGADFSLELTGSP